MKLSVYFLILSIFLVFHLSIRECVFVFVGYGLFSFIDWRISRWRKFKLAGEHLYWEKDLEDPHMENHGDLSRVRLEGDSQVMVHRILDFLSEM
jgi:hypothetical protein